MIRAVIFDMDGLMIETESLQSKAYEHIIKSFGKQPQYLANGLVHPVGIRGDDAWKVLLEKHGIQGDIETLRQKKRDIYIEILKREMKPLPGLLQLLTYLQKNTINIGVVSGSKKYIVELILDGLHITSYFAVIIGGDEVLHGKPDPEGFIKAAHTLKIDPSECLVLEDSGPGIEAAHAAGMKAIAIPTLYTKEHDFTKADRIATTLEEVEHILVSQTL